MTFDPFDGLRQFNAVLGMAAFGLLTWRLVGRWSLMSKLSRIVVALLGALVFLAAMGTARAAALDAPFNEVQYALLVHFVTTIGTCLAWPRLLDRTGRRR